MATLPFDAVQQVTRTKLVAALKKAEVLRISLAGFKTIEEKCKWIEQDPEVEKAFASVPELVHMLSTGNVEERFVLALAVLLDQFDRLFHGIESLKARFEKIRSLVDLLVSTERFYRPIGGLLGYYEQVLRLLAMGQEETFPGLFPPPMEDMRDKTKAVWRYCYEGVSRLRECATIFTVGGAGERLRLMDPDTKEPLPVACLIFGGRTLLEWLFRDIEALEYWHFRVFGKQISIPILLMTSLEKNNDAQIEMLCQEHGWFGKRPDSIFRIVQQLVPVVTTDGQWACTGPLQLMARPGGHGVIWKLANDAGAFEWLAKSRISSVFVRQINNPLAGLDHTLFSFLGMGLQEKKSFGFVACPSRPGFAEGLNVLVVNKDKTAGISNIEYTKFGALQKRNPHLMEGSCPANTNILFANVKAVANALQNLPIPGMVVNAKCEADVVEGEQNIRRPVARLESMMQSIAEAMMAPVSDPFDKPETAHKLPTFLALYDRTKMFSVTKRSLAAGQSPYETPECCLYDWYLACRKLLNESCSFNLPAEQTLDQFLQSGPNCTFFFHPALGPLWDVIGQKLSGGEIFPGGELELEIAEFFARDLSVKGSLRILCDTVVGQKDAKGQRHFTSDVGRVLLENVSIENEGLAEASLADHLKRTVQRASSCTIMLKGASELVARDVVIRGDFSLTVPEGKRVTLRQMASGGVEAIEEPYSAPSWHYGLEWKPQEAPRIYPLKSVP
jgi:UTP---glucose-1-phosphate uridylyltransferase